ncbi:MAG: M20 family metallopeptidase [Synergistaceae bacterium]|jgi:amidohydrolase|nr:M20 family metallopeptidase [Synergistaceae bacterium]
MLSEKDWRALFEEVEKLRDVLVKTSSKIWENPEIGHQEFMAADLLCGVLESNGFEVERNSGGMKTAFRGSFRSDKKGPTVAFIAEYDALPELGHACGHNLFCCSALGAAIALRGFLKETGGEVQVLGSPAEEGTVPNYGGKVTLLKKGYFERVDCAFTAHGENETVIERSLAATMALEVTFRGQPAHAGGSPEKGVNALTAGMLTLNNINAMRQHNLAGDIVNGVVVESSSMPNTIPDLCRMKFSIRGRTSANLKRVLKVVTNSVEAAALVTGCTFETKIPENFYEDTRPNHELGLVMAEALKVLGMPFRASDTRGYGWDAGNVSCVRPLLAPYFKIGPETLTGHTREFCEASNSEEAREAMLSAAKAMGAVALEYLVSEELREKVRREFETVTKG